MSFEFTQQGYTPPLEHRVNFIIEHPALLQPMTPYCTAAGSAAWQSSHGRFTALEVIYSRTRMLDKSALIQRSQPIGLQTAYSVRTGGFTQLNNARAFRFGKALGNAQSRLMSWRASSIMDHSAGLQWLTNISKVDAISHLLYATPKAKDKHWNAIFWHVGFQPLHYNAPAIYQPPPQSAFNFNFSGESVSTEHDQKLDFHPLPKRQPFAISSDVQYRWGMANWMPSHTSIVWQPGVRKNHDWGDPPPPPEPPPVNPEPPEPEFTEVIQVMNSIQILSMPERTPIHATVSLSSDVDSYCWAASLEVHGKAQLAALKPTASGPREIQVTINGYVFKLFIESITKRGQFPSESYAVTASSFHRQFGAPWAPLLTATMDTATSALQLIDQLLANTGFSIERPNVAEWHQTPDFTIAPDSFSYQNQTPIEVIKTLCEAVGAVLLPHPSERKWTLQPRYLVSPWALSEAPANAFNHIISASINLDWQSEIAPEPFFNGVLISGINYGLAVDVTRQGSGGTKRAPDIFSDLHQDNAQCIERGRNELAKCGEKELLSFDMPLMPSGVAPELVMPGKLCRYVNPNNPSENVAGVALSVAINASNAADVRQQVTIEVDHGNH